MPTSRRPTPTPAVNTRDRMASVSGAAGRARRAFWGSASAAAAGLSASIAGVAGGGDVARRLILCANIAAHQDPPSAHVHRSTRRRPHAARARGVCCGGGGDGCRRRARRLRRAGAYSGSATTPARICGTRSAQWHAHRGTAAAAHGRRLLTALLHPSPSTITSAGFATGNAPTAAQPQHKLTLHARAHLRERSTHTRSPPAHQQKPAAKRTAPEMLTTSARGGTCCARPSTATLSRPC